MNDKECDGCCYREVTDTRCIVCCYTQKKTRKCMIGEIPLEQREQYGE